ncbi:MAG: hypothetical protein K9N35_03180 [Candidatus Marinimicrobia bacterium]|nr:hypothetical protein [Candidatus Neomarinimicrobiota bacterium]
MSFVNNVILKIRPMKHTPKLVLFALFLQVVCGLHAADQSPYIPDLGISLNGSTGLFYIPSAQTLDVGHIRIGLLPAHSSQFIPFNFALGISPKIEIFLSHNQQSTFNNALLGDSQIGTKINLLTWHDANLALSAKSSQVEYISNPLPSSVSNYRFYQATLISEYTLGNVNAILQVGLQERTFEERRVKRGLYFGLAGSRPLFKNLQVSGEYFLDGSAPEGYESFINAGIKTFVFSHLQVGMAYGFCMSGDQSQPVIQAMAGFSTRPLIGFPLAKHTNLWQDLKDLFSGFGLFSPPYDSSISRPEFYVGPKDYDLPLAPSLSALKANENGKTTDIEQPEFIIPERLKLPVPPSLEVLKQDPNN